MKVIWNVLAVTYYVGSTVLILIGWTYEWTPYGSLGVVMALGPVCVTWLRDKLRHT